MNKRLQNSLDFVKNWDLVHTLFSDVETRKITLLIENRVNGRSTKISDVLHHLPSGFCNKCETGFGATTAEIKNVRNSIIVEPVRHTAISKQEQNGGFYYGTKPGRGRDKKMMRDLEIYLRSSTPLPKKIFCVADRLKEVVYKIWLPEFLHLNFHLFVDEVDTVQLDSTYRKVMNVVMEIYKIFPAERRTAVTATFLDFSDPELANEPLTELRYKNPTPRKVHLVKTNDMVMETVSQIQQKLTKNPNDKIVVAINHFKTIMQVIGHLKLAGLTLKEDEVKILASDENKVELGNFYGEVIKGILPGRLIFMTSAFFTGYDFEERYHFIMLGSLNHEAFCISEQLFMQASGRGRKGRISETLIMESEIKRSPYFAEKNTLENDAKIQLDLIEQVNNILKHSSTLKDQVRKVQSDVINRFPFGSAPLLYESPDEKIRISYNTIDALVEKSRVHQDLYANKDGMEKRMLELGWEVTSEVTMHQEPVELKMEDPHLEKQLQNISATLWESAKFGHRVELDFAKQNSIEKDIYQVYNEYYRYFDTAYLVKQIRRTFRSKNGKETTKPSGITKQISSLKSRLWFATLDPHNPLKIQIESKLEVGQIYERAQLEQIINGAFSTTGLVGRKWLTFLRTIFKVSDVKMRPTAIKLQKRYIPSEEVRFPVVRTFIDN